MSITAAAARKVAYMCRSNASSALGALWRQAWRMVALEEERAPADPGANAPTPADMHGDLRDIWQVAAAPDVPQLRRLLAARPLLPSVLHPRMRVTPLLAAAYARTDDSSVDAALKVAMQLLIAAGDPLLAGEPFSGNTALHILSAQRRPFTVKHRLQALVPPPLSTLFRVVSEMPHLALTIVGGALRHVHSCLCPCTYVPPPRCRMLCAVSRPSLCCLSMRCWHTNRAGLSGVCMHMMYGPCTCDEQVRHVCAC